MKSQLSTLAFAAIALACATAPASAAVQTFNATGTFVGGGSLSGTVYIDTASGNVTAADLSATVPITYTLNQNVGNIPNYGGSGADVIVADANTPSFYPITLLGIDTPNFINYTGGPISTSSNLQFSDGSGFRLTSGSLTTASSTIIAGDTLTTFNLIASLTDNNSITGTVTIDTTNGNVTAADLLATVNTTYTLNQNVGNIPNYGGSGVDVIVADANTPSFYPITLLGIDTPTFINYTGGPISTSSNLQFSDGSGFRLASGSLTLTPEPASACLLLGALPLFLRRRK